MIWPMANSQMLISKKPSTDAMVFIPRDRKMIRMVESVTTQSSAKKMSSGKYSDMAIQPSGGPIPWGKGAPYAGRRSDARPNRRPAAGDGRGAGRVAGVGLEGSVA